jgi:hypothetical protein
VRVWNEASLYHGCGINIIILFGNDIEHKYCRKWKSPISVTPQIPLCLRAPALTAIDEKIKNAVDLNYGLSSDCATRASYPCAASLTVQVQEQLGKEQEPGRDALLDNLLYPYQL